MPSPVDVLVCVKRVPDITEEVVLSDDGQSVDGRRSGFTMSAHEECAVELAVQTTVASGGEATVLTLGDADAVEQLRNALAVGCTAATHVLGEQFTFGPADVAREIAAVVRDHEARGARPRPGAARQRRRRQRRLPGRHPARLRARATGRQRRLDGHRRGLPRRPRRGRRRRGPRRPGDLPRTAPGRRDDPRGRRRAALPVRARTAQGQEGPDRGAPTGRPSATGSGRVRLVLPPPTPSAVQILGEGPEAAPAVVDVLEKLGVLTR